MRFTELGVDAVKLLIAVISPPKLRGNKFVGGGLEREIEGCHIFAREVNGDLAPVLEQALRSP